MSQEGIGKCPRAAHAFKARTDGVVDALEIFSATVSQFLAFNVSPESLQRVQFRRISGQSLNSEPTSLSTQVFDHEAALMRRQAIPDEHGLLSAQMAFEIAEERDQAFRIETTGARLKVQTTTASIPAEAQRGTDRKRFPRERMDQDRCLPSGRPGPSHRGQVGDAAFVFEENPGFPAPSVFFTTGHLSETHRRIASGLRSRACRAGRWRDQSIAPRIFQT